MWRSSELIGYGIRAKDGAIGTVMGLLCDDAGWTLRWAAVCTGAWRPGRRFFFRRRPSVIRTDRVANSRWTTRATASNPAQVSR